MEVYVNGYPVAVLNYYYHDKAHTIDICLPTCTRFVLGENNLSNHCIRFERLRIEMCTFEW